MEKIKLLTPLLLILISMLCIRAHAETDPNRLLQLEATVRELTLQNAKLIEENKRLSDAMKEALHAQRLGKVVVSGCDLDPLARNMVNSGDDYTKENILKKWLNTNGERCTKNQLQKVQENLTVWGVSPYSPYRKTMEAPINYWLQR